MNKVERLASRVAGADRIGSAPQSPSNTTAGLAIGIPGWLHFAREMDCASQAAHVGRAHPCILHDSRWSDLLCVCERERIDVATVSATLPVKGMLTSYQGVVVVMLRAGQPQRTRRAVLLHELAHFWLHMGHEVGTIENGPRQEAEANALAAAIMREPIETVERYVRG